MRRVTFHSPRRAAFTLIEVLVVVAIVALLAAILLPSLQRAREQAKMAIDMSNLKQIGQMMGTYQAAAQGSVPVLLNYYAWGYNRKDAGGADTIPARVLRPSVALRNSDGRRRLSEPFDPEKHWEQETRAEYERAVLPDHYVCPFARGTGSESMIRIGEKLIQGTGPAAMYTMWEWRGRHESYHSWLWQELDRGEPVRNELHPNDPREGRPKYSVLTWNRVTATGKSDSSPNAIGPSHLGIRNMHRTWAATEARARKGASMSDVTVLYCAQGNFLAFNRHINNPESHRTSAGPGTLALFGDGHVEWVPGTQIGWP